MNDAEAVIARALVLVERIANALEVLTVAIGEGAVEVRIANETNDPIPVEHVEEE